MTNIYKMDAYRPRIAYPAIDWLYAFEDIAKANADFVIRVYFVWPRVLLRVFQ